MINNNMFSGQPTIKDYRDIVLDDVLREFLLFKGTWDNNGNKTNEKVRPKDLVSSALFIYGLKDNATNKSSVAYYCEREARKRLLMLGDYIVIPTSIWRECDEYNKKYTGKGGNSSDTK